MLTLTSCPNFEIDIHEFVNLRLDYRTLSLSAYQPSHSTIFNSFKTTFPAASIVATNQLNSILGDLHWFSIKFVIQNPFDHP